MLVDCRFLPGQLDDVVGAIASTLDPDMGLVVETSMPGHEASLGGPFVGACQRVIGRYDPGAVVAPWIAPAGSDAQRLAALGIECYGFAPLPLPAGAGYLEHFHAVDERVPVESLRAGFEMLRSLVTDY